VTTTYRLDRATDLDAEMIRQIAAGAQVELGRGALDVVAASAAAARRVLAAGPAVYGVSTGMGALSSVRLTEAEQAAHQPHLLAGRAAGGPPWLPVPEVRALLAVRLRTFLSGDAAVSAGLCQRLADFLAAGVVPAVPAQAGGSAGELIPLAHAFGPLAGLGEVLDPAGRSVPAGPVLAAAGLSQFALGPKEGIALLQGVPGATALSLLAVAEARLVAEMLRVTAALSIGAIGAPGDPYEAVCARGDEVLQRELAALRAELGTRTGPPRMLQAPVSFRVAGVAAAHLARALAALEAAVERALAGVTDSPAFLDGRFLGTAGFDGIDLAGHCDQLTAAVAHAAEVSAARTHRLLDPRVTGLAAQLAARPGPDAGLVTVHKRAAGEVHALRRLAQPAALGTIETSAGQEDVQSWAWAAASALRAGLGQARLVTACELLTAYQAATLAGRAGEHRIGAGPGRELLDRLSALVEPVAGDRSLGPDIERLAAGCWHAAATAPDQANDASRNNGECAAG
jgi:histidine ammonia-lyase